MRVLLRRVMCVGAAALFAGVAVAGCSPVKMGAAAIVGNQRITIANLDTEAGRLASAAKSYPGVITLTPQQITQQSLSWLIRFKINEQLASRYGISVSTAEAQTSLASIYASAKAQAQSSGVTNAPLNLILVAYGIPPDLGLDLGRYQAIELRFVRAANGGKLPAANSAAAGAAAVQLTHAQCQVAKSLNIEVNPQFGRLDYSNYSVATAADTVSRPAGPVRTASTSGLTPAC